MVKKLFVIAVCLVLTCVCRAVRADDLSVPSQYGTIQSAIDNANDGDTVIVDEGEYPEYVNFLGKAITLMSTDPDDPNVVANTRIIGGSDPIEGIYNVDDSDDLAEGVTVSMSPLNTADLENPLAGVLWYCQDEIADGQAGGSRSTATFDTALANEAVEQEFCVMLVAGFRELA